VLEVTEGVQGVGEADITYKLKNLGATIFDVCWSCDETSLLVWDVPSIIGSGSTFHLTMKQSITEDTTRRAFVSRPPFNVQMFFVDCEGNERHQTYSCTPQKYKGFECIDHGIGKNLRRSEN
jgi:hypothetical protein